MSDAPWNPILAAWCGYLLFSFLNGLIGEGNLQIIGALGFLGFLGLLSARRMFPIALSGLNVALGFAALVPAVSLLAGLTAEGAFSASYTVKYAAVLFMILAADALRLPPLYQASGRWWSMGLLVGILLVGWILTAPEDRVGGTFVNPNNYALAALGILFLVDHEYDRRWLKITIHLAVILLITFSGTLGALLGYLIGAGAHVWRMHLMRPATILLLALLLSLSAFFAKDRVVAALSRTGRLESLWTKVAILQDYSSDIKAGEELNFWEIGQEYGGVELTSAAWRLMHWQEALRVFNEAAWPAKWLGMGLGSSEVRLGHLPHNDYLRLLLEVGILGLLANAAVWIILYLRAPPSASWPAVAMAAYSFSENNFDNFLVISLLILFLVSSANRFPGHNPGRLPGPTVFSI